MDFKKIIEEKGIKQSWIAKKLGVSSAFVSMCLSGEKSFPSDKEEMLKKILL